MSNIRRPRKYTKDQLAIATSLREKHDKMVQGFEEMLKHGHWKSCISAMASLSEHDMKVLCTKENDDQSVWKLLGPEELTRITTALKMLQLDVAQILASLPEQIEMSRALRREFSPTEDPKKKETAVIFLLRAKKQRYSKKMASAISAGKGRASGLVGEKYFYITSYNDDVSFQHVADRRNIKVSDFSGFTHVISPKDGVDKLEAINEFILMLRKSYGGKKSLFADANNWEIKKINDNFYNIFSADDPTLCKKSTDFNLGQNAVLIEESGRRVTVRVSAYHATKPHLIYVYDPNGSSEKTRIADVRDMIKIDDAKAA